MDQDSFRQLIQTPHPESSTPALASRGSIFASFKQKPKTTDPSQPAFKPRKVNKKQTDGKYRDRAAERRVGEGNDYAQVEAVLEDFERRAAENADKNAVEEQRRYLGGDSDHSILVKGLDFALLEQNKARAAQSNEDDDSIEQAYLEAVKQKEVPQAKSKKRTREELVRELKESRSGRVAEEEKGQTKMEEVMVLEEAKKLGKFKPIGGAGDEKGKKKKKGEGERKKKKQKIDGGGEEKTTNGTNATQTVKDKGEMLPPPIPVASTSAPNHQPEIEPDYDFDIFAGAGEYEGIDLGEDDDEEGGEGERKPKAVADVPPQPIRGQWFAREAGEPLPPPPPPSRHTVHNSEPKFHSPPPAEDVREEPELPTRLLPLESSALPSIKDLLALDAAQDKKKKGKTKKKGGGEDKKMSAEVKADRDYKRLKSYAEKKAGVPNSKR